MDKLDLSLDELAKASRRPKQDRKPKAKVAKAAPVAAKPQAAPSGQRPGSAGKGGAGILARVGGAGPVGTTVLIRNLDFKVTSRDVRELATTIGEIKRGDVVIVGGKSSGVAEVVYVNKADAYEAVRKFNNVTFDGRPMDVSIAAAGAGSGKEAVFGSALSGGGFGGGARGGGPKFSVTLSDPALGRPKQQHQQQQDRRIVVQPGGRGGNSNGNGNGNGGKGAGRDGTRPGGGGGKSGGGDKREKEAKKPTQEELDRQLDAFLAKK